MYDVIFKIVVEPFTKLREMDKSRKHTFINYLKKHLTGYNIYNYDFEYIESDFLYLDTCNISIYDEDNIEEYNSVVNKFKQFADEEYNKISKYCFNAKVTAYMGVYNKEAYEKSEKSWFADQYFRDNKRMPDYNTILQQYCEVKTYIPKRKIMKSEFTRYEDIKITIKFKLDYDNENIVLTKMPIKKVRELFNDFFYNDYSIMLFGREEMVNGYTPRYKLGDIVEYEGKIAIVRRAPELIEHYGNKMMSTAYGLDFITKNGYYSWTDGEFVTNDDLEPYTGDVPEFMKLLQEAVLEKNGYSIVPRGNDVDIDRLLEQYNVITEFDKFKDRLIKIFKTPGGLYR